MRSVFASYQGREMLFDARDLNISKGDILYVDVDASDMVAVATSDAFEGDVNSLLPKVDCADSHDSVTAFDGNEMKEYVVREEKMQIIKGIHI